MTFKIYHYVCKFNNIKITEMMTEWQMDDLNQIFLINIS